MTQWPGAERSHPTRACANCSAVDMGVVEGVGGEVKFRDSGMIRPLALGVLLTGLALFARRFGQITYYSFIGLALWLIVIVVAIFQFAWDHSTDLTNRAAILSRIWSRA